MDIALVFLYKVKIQSKVLWLHQPFFLQVMLGKNKLWNVFFKDMIVWVLGGITILLIPPKIVLTNKGFTLKHET